jgi:small conductance mechanosensitive channel
VLALVVAQIDPTAACGVDPSYICRQVLSLTHSNHLAELADVVFAKPLSILLVVVLAIVVNSLARRAIGRFVGAMTGNQKPTRRLKRTLRGTRMGNVLPQSVLDTGVMSLRASARAATLGAILRSLATFVIWAIAGTTILGELGIDLAPLIAGAGLAGVAIGFGAQSLVKDFLAGLFILIEDQYGVGDIIDAGEASGTVESVSLRATRIRDVQGTMWHVPNGQILRVGNKSQQWARALLDLSVAYGTDIPAAEAVIKRVADELWQDPAWSGQVLEEPEVWGIEELGPHGVTIRLVVKTLPARQFDVMRALRGRIKQGLQDAGVELANQPRSVVLSEPAPERMPVVEPPAPSPAKRATKRPAKRPAKRS